MKIKLTDQKMKTYGDFQWGLNEWKETSGKDSLCGPGWIHYYDGTPELAIALNPIHARFSHPRLFKVDVGGKIETDYGLKCGTTKLRLVEELPVPLITLNALARWAIYCVQAIPDRKLIPIWDSWAEEWLSGENRTKAATRAVARPAGIPLAELLARSITEEA